jgi:hypothetical protein
MNTTAKRCKLRRLTRDLAKDLSRLRGLRSDPETFAGGCHARFVREIRRGMNGIRNG